MNRSSWSFLFFIGVLFFLAACQKENDVSPRNENTDNAFSIMARINIGNAGSNNLSSSDSSDFDECFKIVFPIQINFPNETTVLVANDEEFIQILEEWYNANVNPEDFPRIAYPLMVQFENGTSQEVKSEEEFCDLLFECFGGQEHWDEYECFEYVFPITIIADGVETTLSDEDAYIEFLDKLFDSIYTSEDATDFMDSLFYTFKYPITVILEGEPILIHSDEELDALYIDCACPEIELSDCLELKYPVQIKFPDDSVTSVNSEEELDNLIEDFIEANPFAKEAPELVYPITVVDEDGIEHNVESEDAFEALVDEKC